MGYENRAFIIGVNLTDIEHPPSSQHFFADVVLIDKSNEILNPLLYRVKSEELHLHDDLVPPPVPGVMKLQNNAFAMIGEVLSIDKKKKQIYLKNQNTVTYRHLIVASGLKSTSLGTAHDDELSGGLHALIEALRIRKNTKQKLQFPSKDQLGFQNHKSSHSAHQLHSEEMTSESILKALLSDSFGASAKSLNMALSGTDKRLYEVQL